MTERPFRIGMVRLTDAAPYVMAGELGFFKEAGLPVQLSWELGWSSIKHKLAHGQLDAAQALAPMALSLASGFEVAATPCRALMATSRLGNCITLSQAFHERGVQNAEDFRQEVRSSKGGKRYTFGVVSVDSCHHILLRSWLESIGIDPDEDVRIVVIPPGQALRNLRARTLDGYCVGEPWNSLAVREGIGWVIAYSHELAPQHIEKVLLAREDTLLQCKAEVDALVGALIKACTFCADKSNAGAVARKMRRRVALGSAGVGMEKVLRGTFDLSTIEKAADIPLLSFCTEKEASITRSDIQWLAEGALGCGWLPLGTNDTMALAHRVYVG